MALCYGNSVAGTSGINGDAFFISQDNTTIMLSDGASGAGKEGKVIMSSYCKKIIAENSFSDSGLPVKEYIDKIIGDINDGLIKISQANKVYTFGTLVICIVWDNIATIASIGDSPAYHISNNNIKRVAKTGKTYQHLIEIGILTEEQAEASIKQLPEYMWSMFDRFIPMIVPIYSLEEIELKNGDAIVLCSDGISDNVKPNEMKDMINFSNISDNVSDIIETAKNRSVHEKDRNFYDDITMVIYYHW